MSEFPFKIDFEISRNAKDLIDCIKLDKVKRERSNITIEKKNEKLLIVIEARDPVALRASFDGLIKLIITYEKMKYEVQ